MPKNHPVLGEKDLDPKFPTGLTISKPGSAWNIALDTLKGPIHNNNIAAIEALVKDLANALNTLLPGGITVKAALNPGQTNPGLNMLVRELNALQKNRPIPADQDGEHVVLLCDHLTAANIHDISHMKWHEFNSDDTAKVTTLALRQDSEESFKDVKFKLSNGINITLPFYKKLKHSFATVLHDQEKVNLATMVRNNGPEGFYPEPDGIPLTQFFKPQPANNNNGSNSNNRNESIDSSQAIPAAQPPAQSQRVNNNNNTQSSKKRKASDDLEQSTQLTLVHCYKSAKENNDKFIQDAKDTWKELTPTRRNTVRQVLGDLNNGDNYEPDYSKFGKLLQQQSSIKPPAVAADSPRSASSATQSNNNNVARQAPLAGQFISTTSQLLTQNNSPSKKRNG